MELNWFESCILGLFSGLLDIIPVSAQAHKVLLLKFFGVKASSDVMNLLIHVAVFAAIYYSSQTQLVRMKSSLPDKASGYCSSLLWNASSVRMPPKLPHT